MVDQNLKGKHDNYVAFGDLHLISMQSIQYEKDAVQNYMVRLLEEFSMAKHIITSYCVTRDHWILAAVVAKRNKVFYLDSLRNSMQNRKEAYFQFMELIQE